MTETAYIVALDLHRLAERLRLDGPHEAARWLTRPSPERPGDLACQKLADKSPFRETNEWGRYYVPFDPTGLIEEDCILALIPVEPLQGHLNGIVEISKLRAGAESGGGK